MMKKRMSNWKKLDIILISTFIYIFLFVITAWVTYYLKGDVPDTLIQYGLSGGTLELVLSAAIEIFSNKRGKKDE